MVKRIDENELSNLHNDGLNDVQISEKLNCHKNTICALRKKLGLSSIKKLEKIDRGSIIKLNLEGFNDNEISKIIKCDPSTICHIRKELGLPKIKSSQNALRKYDYELIKHLSDGTRTLRELSDMTKYPISAIRDITWRLHLPFKKGYRKGRGGKSRKEWAKFSAETRRNEVLKSVINKVVKKACPEWDEDKKFLLIAELEMKMKNISYKGRSMKKLVPAALYLTNKCLKANGVPFRLQELEQLIGKIHAHDLNYLRGYDGFQDICRIAPIETIHGKREKLLSYFSSILSEEHANNFLNDLFSKAEELLNYKEIKYLISNPYLEGAGVFYYLLKKNYILTKMIHISQWDIADIFNTNTEGLRNWEKKLLIIDKTPPMPLPISLKTPSLFSNPLIISRKKKLEKTCIMCREVFYTNSQNKNFCSASCRHEYIRITSLRKYNRLMGQREPSQFWGNIFNDSIIEKPSRYPKIKPIQAPKTNIWQHDIKKYKKRQKKIRYQDVTEEMLKFFSDNFL